ncbi:hypothetical protein EK21DRAFT_53985 [Setomelanomma holmii]|uniref:Uncharacterized protein n=1 Tax=Setomelanomma holmii TaxID=210430 RepID=A0A9P4HHV9_9PLEO|nr:hypothetical protein EK21DRAFT_53985 [Setomelanomma holmii]
MSFCCQTCEHRNNAIQASGSSRLDVCLVVLTFKNSPLPHKPNYRALNAVLNNILDNEETSPHPTTFTSWSPCLANYDKAVIISTAKEACSSSMSPVYDAVRQYLTTPPSIQHIFLDYSVLTLAAPSPDQRHACDIYQLQAPNLGVAGVIANRFGRDPKQSSLTLQMANCASAAFSHPGDLVKELWAWAELQDEDSMPASAAGSTFTASHESLPDTSSLESWNSDEKNMSRPVPDDDYDDRPPAYNDGTLIMIFKWSSHANADRFKHPLQASYGPNNREVRNDLWDTSVANPIRQLQGLGARTETYKLELRAVEPRTELSTRAEEPIADRVRRGSKRLSVMASGLGEKVSGLWK